MIRLSNESLITLEPVLKLFSYGIFISENGDFQALGGDKLISGKLGQRFSRSGHFDQYLLDGNGDACASKAELRFLRPSRRNLPFTDRFSEIISRFEDMSSDQSNFFLSDAICRFIENKVLNLGRALTSLRKTQQDLKFSVNLNDDPTRSFDKNEIIIHEFKGAECQLQFGGESSSGFLNGFKRLKNEEFICTIFHSGLLLLESTMRDFSVVKGVKIMT